MRIRVVRGLVLLLVFVILGMAAPAHRGNASASTNRILLHQVVQSMLDQVTVEIVEQYTGDLSGSWEVTIDGSAYTITTRHALSGEPAAKAALYLFQFYQALGIQVDFNYFSFSDQILTNIIAEKKGSIFPERIFMITSHYDDVPVEGPAPGADDNASGTIGVMLAAEILSQHVFGCTLRFINFGAEEYGMIGSKEYAKQSYCAGEDIRGVINLDMIAWNTPGSTPGLDIHSLSSIPGTDDLAAAFQDAVSEYNLDLVAELADPITTRSDHSSFWRYNYPAILVSEDWDDFNPNYHSTNDDLDSLQDLEYYTNMIKASLATLAQAGCLVEDGWGTVSGQVIAADTKEPLSGLSIRLHSPQWGFSWYTRSDGSGNFQFSAPGGWHELSIDGYGYTRQAAGVSISPDETTVHDFEIERSAEEAVFLPFSANISHIPPEGCP